MQAVIAAAVGALLGGLVGGGAQLVEALSGGSDRSLPIALIAVSFFKTAKALNPALLFPAIEKLREQYLVAWAVLNLVWGLCELMHWIRGSALGFPGLGMLLELVGLYLLFVEMRIVGVLYRTNAERLEWM